jgi:hypothetical protein
MTALGVIQISLCVFSLAAAAILIPIVRYQIYRHLRRHHRKAFDRLAISGPSFLWREDRDAEGTAFEQFFSSGTRDTKGSATECITATREPNLAGVWREFCTPAYYFLGVPGRPQRGMGFPSRSCPLLNLPESGHLRTAVQDSAAG